MRTDTGGFIASAGLESYYAHGFLTHALKPGASHQQAVVQRTIDFVEFSLTNYVHSVFPFLHAAFHVTQSLAHDIPRALRALAWLDAQHHTLLLNHVARRASLIQGSALLSLYSKSFAQRDPAAHALVDRLRIQARRGCAKLNSGTTALQPEAEELAGHLAICAGVFAAVVGLSAERMLRQNLFLQARNIMSCSIRLNTIGPYMAHQLLASQLHELVARQFAALDRDVCQHLYDQALRTSEAETSPVPRPSSDPPRQSVWDWDWDDPARQTPTCTPSTTWPLGEIIQARHDQLHSRLFNS